MITFKVGNIIESQTEALVNTVNTVGIMGKGIALAFRKAFPNVYDEYLKAVNSSEIVIGKVQVVETKFISPVYVINFPTKKHWRHPSKIEYIESGLKSLVNVISSYNIKSISIPPLGCGNGKLDWKEVKPLMLKYLNPLQEEIDIIIYEPGYSDQKMTKKDYVELTAPRAMLIYLLKHYQVLGYSANLLVAQKLAYFLQRFGEPLNLIYEKGHYGPYAHRLLHLMKFLNGYYLWFKEENNKPGTTVNLDISNYPKVKEYFEKNVSDEQKSRVNMVIDFINGYESPYGLELLATVDFVIQNIGKTDQKQVKEAIYSWTTRKKSLMKTYHIEIATKHIISNFYN